VWANASEMQHDKSWIRTLEWLDVSEHNNVILEMDCKLVIDDVNKDKLNVSGYGVILPDCKIPSHITIIT